MIPPDNVRQETTRNPLQVKVTDHDDIRRASPHNSETRPSPRKPRLLEQQVVFPSKPMASTKAEHFTAVSSGGKVLMSTDICKGHGEAQLRTKSATLPEESNLFGNPTTGRLSTRQSSSDHRTRLKNNISLKILEKQTNAP